MKLYYAPGTCSLTPHIIAREAGLDLDTEKVQFGPVKKTETGKDYSSINPKGPVPALELDDGQVLTENQVILQYLASLAPKANLMPSDGMARWRALELLNFIASDIHKGAFTPLFTPTLSPEMRETIVATLGKKFTVLENILGDKPYLMGDQLTLPDAYAFVALNWCESRKIDVNQWPKLVAFQKRMAARPAVQRAMKEQGMLAA